MNTLLNDPLLTTRQVANITSYSHRTLERQRLLNEGPPWVRLNRRTIRYRLSAVEAWLKSRGA
jgi:predicted DNA-binding transcriptional regulator AlpA